MINFFSYKAARVGRLFFLDETAGKPLKYLTSASIKTAAGKYYHQKTN